MTTLANSIWRVPVYLPYVQPPLNDIAVAAAERHIGFPLPYEYLDLLQHQNGGYIRLSLEGLPHDTINGIGPYFPSLGVDDWEDAQEHVSYPLQGLVPFDGDGHWHLCLDYRSNADTPCVSYVDIEVDEQSEIAPTFADYLAKLRLEVPDDFVVEPGKGFTEVVDHLSSALGITFGAPDTRAHGYPTYGARFEAHEDSQWVWLSPNTVPLGFVRSEDARYDELKNMMQGTARRFPEAPDGCILITATEDVHDAVAEACRTAPFSVKPLREYVKG